MIEDAGFFHLHDVRYVYFQDPADDTWRRLEWEHAAMLGTPFSFRESVRVPAEQQLPRR